MKYAGVIVDVQASTVNRPFHYEIPPNLSQLRRGHRVLVPFGRRKVEGYVVEIIDTIDFDPTKIKPVIKLLDPKPVLSNEQLAVAKWMVETYAGLYSQAIQCFLPAGTRYGKARVSKKTQLVASLINDQETQTKIAQLSSRAFKQRELVLRLEQQSPQLVSELITKTGASHQSLRALKEKGIVKIESEHITRELEFNPEVKPIPTLNIDQERVLKKIIDEYNTDQTPVLVHGVTDSGKTEVYLRSIEYCIEQGRQAIMMVPEIALTPQTIARFSHRFPNQIAVLHSGLSEGERYDQWQQIYSGKLPIVIGARSAVFAPLANIGLIVIDEEHETTYKQEEGMVKYHARAVAIERAKHHGAQVVLGSATPAIESYHAALRQEYTLVEMPTRINNRPFPQVKLVDMRAEFNAGNREMFSRLLTTKLEEIVARQEQAIILLNRRGYSTFMLCRECGYVVGCPNCQVSLTYHQSGDRLKCHYCGYHQAQVDSCPQCASRYIREFGRGTQKLQEYIRKKFPAARTIRLDSDTTRKKGAHQRILDQFGSGKANILIGTQMIAKGLDFPNVTLVGVLSADFALNFPDFRAAERTYQLLAQVSGRAGRDEKLGEVVIQCYDPTHYAIEAVQKHDYSNFYRQEITFRRELGYPPFGHLVRILIQGGENVVQERAREVFDILKQSLPEATLFGPSPAPIGKIKGRHRWQIIIKSSSAISGFLAELPKSDSTFTISVDVDPLFFL